VKALECQARDLGLDVVVSSRELLKVSGQRHSVTRMGFEEDVSGTRWRKFHRGYWRWESHWEAVRVEQVRNDEVRSQRQLGLVKGARPGGYDSWVLALSLLRFLEGPGAGSFLPSMCLCLRPFELKAPSFFFFPFLF
jgi:hypothetical protein